ncbi:hypothetical protein [Phenylobacterium sp.]|uniref:hypothetical protein n=1 Tax=Phenylobacterium sp. TaxID=1871053 RepID=UPI0035B2C5FD
MTLEGMQIAVAVAATGCGVASFALYALACVRTLTSQPQVKTAAAAAQRAQFTTPADVAELIKALGALTDSLAKAGPALWSLIGSVLFLLVAAISVGVLQSPPAQKTAERPSPAAAAPAAPKDPRLGLRPPGGS